MFRKFLTVAAFALMSNVAHAGITDIYSADCQSDSSKFCRYSEFLSKQKSPVPTYQLVKVRAYDTKTDFIDRSYQISCEHKTGFDVHRPERGVSPEERVTTRTVEFQDRDLINAYYKLCENITTQIPADYDMYVGQVFSYYCNSNGFCLNSRYLLNMKNNDGAVVVVSHDEDAIKREINISCSNKTVWSGYGKDRTVLKVNPNDSAVDIRTARKSFANREAINAWYYTCQDETNKINDSIR